MNPNGHLSMNGYQSNGNGASSGSHNFGHDFPHPHPEQNLFHHTVPVQQHQRQQHHQSPPAMQGNSSNHWQQQQQQQHPMAANAHLTPSNIHAQHQPVFNQSAWGNQMPQQQQMGAMLPMGAFNMPLISQQIIQEAFSMSTPVDATDEPVLLTTLLNAKKADRSFREALNSLHGTNGHSASLWKDYYLEHKDRLDDWIDNCVKKERANKLAAARQNMGTEPQTVMLVDRALAPTAKKPSLASFKREPSPHFSTSSRPSISAPPVKHPPRMSNKSTPTPPVKEVPSIGRRNTVNSLSAPAPVFGARLPPPNADIKIPEPPSRSPSPPTNIVPHKGRGNKYTQEDREFFIKFVGWRLKQDPDLNRHDLCDLLAQKAPHHTAQSWASHWSNNHDLPDKILAAARGDELEGDESSEEEKLPTKRRGKPTYKDPSTSEDEDSESDGEDDDDNDDDNDDDVTSFRRYSEKDMAEKGTPFNDADLYITAKYIAEFPNWESTTSKDRWEPYHRVHLQRSAKSWAEYYRRTERELTKLAKKIKLESKGASSPIQNQCARPTRTPPKSKRKLEYDTNEDSMAKRGRAE